MNEKKNPFLSLLRENSHDAFISLPLTLFPRFLLLSKLFVSVPLQFLTTPRKVFERDV